MVRMNFRGAAMASEGGEWGCGKGAGGAFARASLHALSRSLARSSQGLDGASESD